MGSSIVRARQHYAYDHRTTRVKARGRTGPGSGTPGRWSCQPSDVAGGAAPTKKVHLVLRWMLDPYTHHDLDELGAVVVALRR